MAGKKLFFVMIFILLPSVLNAWLFDSGLESTIKKFQNLFEEKKLSQLYFLHVDPVLKSEVNHTINLMKSDKNWGRQIAKRLKFKNYNSYLKATNDKIIKQFFYIMLNSTQKKRSKILNKNYLQLSLALTLLVAPFDKKMKIIDYDIYGNGACVQFKDNKIELNSYLINIKNDWYLTSKNLSKK